MPRRDKTGPQGQGSKTGKGRGKCSPKGGIPAPQGQKGTGSGCRGSRGQGQKANRGAGQGSGRGTGQGRSKRR
jgi:hypothetical protein